MILTLQNINMGFKRKNSLEIKALWLLSIFDIFDCTLGVQNT